MMDASRGSGGWLYRYVPILGYIFLALQDLSNLYSINCQLGIVICIGRKCMIACSITTKYKYRSSNDGSMDAVNFGNNEAKTGAATT